jgi:2-iminobutanoate/2-iminopropanoate deaminase
MPGAEHKRLVEVIKRGDPLAAENAMREHIHSAAEAILKFLRHSESNKKPGPAGKDEEARREKSDVGLSRKSPKEIVAERVELRIPDLAPPVSHYTDAVRAGDFIFISGMAALDKDGIVLAQGDVVQQTRHALDAIGKVLGHGGGNFGDIVKVTVYLKDINDRPRINPVRQEYFGSARPASVLVEVSDLFLPGLLVEIDAIAYVPEHKRRNAEEGSTT